MRETLLSSACRERGIFDPEAVDKLLAGERPFGRRIWGLLNLELWYRQFIDCDTRTELQAYATTASAVET
jgi:asparagine synthase (glutamine-hydrolysing)